MSAIQVISFDENLKGKPISPISFGQNKISVYNPIYIFDQYPLVTNFENIWKYQDPYINERTNGLEEIANANNLYLAEVACKKNVSWKDSVQHGDMNVLRNTRDLQREIRSGEYKQKPPNIFTLNERGKTRLVKSNHFRDRIVQKSLNDNVLFPCVENKLIYDNGASRIGKGLDHARRRFMYSLQSAYNKWGYDCYILVIDFTKYFDNIIHQTLIDELKNLITPEQLQFVANRLHEFEVDVSYMSDEEFESCIFDVFNSLEYDKLDNSLKTGEKFMAKSMGIGSQTSQITGLFYPHELDNYCKIVRGIKEYGRYMDDTFLILPTKEMLLDVYYNGIIPICNKLGIHINEKKTHILKLNNPISYLKLTYLIQQSSKVIIKVHSETFRRERRRITKFRHLCDNNGITLSEILNCYKGWRGTYIKYDSGYDILKLDKFFLQTFPEFNKSMLLKGGKYDE